MGKCRTFSTCVVFIRDGRFTGIVLRRTRVQENVCHYVCHCICYIAYLCLNYFFPQSS